MKRLQHYLLIFLKGIAMGAADVVPGVSGGTIAFITGIYDELLNSIKAINIEAAKVLFREGIGPFWGKVNANFFLCLLGGIGLSFLVFSNVIIFCMETYPVLVWSFFFGLVAGSALYLYKDTGLKNWGCYVAIVAGVLLAYLLTQQARLVLEPSVINVFLAGALAICAMILPGVSGSFILLLLGLYTPIMQAIKTLDFTIIAVFMLGAISGLLLFVRILSWFLNHHRATTISLLTGFLLGSLNLLWPWKHVLSYSPTMKPIIQENVLPLQYTAITGQDAMVWTCITLALTGVAIIWVFEYLSKPR